MQPPLTIQLPLHINPNNKSAIAIKHQHTSHIVIHMDLPRGIFLGAETVLKGKIDEAVMEHFASLGPYGSP